MMWPGLGGHEKDHLYNDVNEDGVVSRGARASSDADADATYLSSFQQNADADATYLSPPGIRILSPILSRPHHTKGINFIHPRIPRGSRFWGKNVGWWGKMGTVQITGWEQ